MNKIKGLLTLLLLSGCTSVPFPVEISFYQLTADEINSSNHGDFTFERVEGQQESAYGGIFTFYHWRQTEGLVKGRIAMAHGFLRSKENMKGWGDWLASRGYEVAIPSFIHSSLLGGNHDKNGRDLKDLAYTLWPGEPHLYGGFSAGGLAAVIAASEDVLAAGWFGLDPVDSGSLAKPAVEKIISRGLPAILLFAEASSCNAKNNFLAPWMDSGGKPDAVVRAPGTVHHAFEDPYDPGAEGLCGVMVPAESPQTVRDWLRVRLWTWLELDL